MASEVDIANLALAHLGDNATVASLDPPEGSAQAEHCARFYPLARDSLLEMHSWSFATTRGTLALMASGLAEWDFAYALPNDTLTVLAVMPPDVVDDYSDSFGSYPSYSGATVQQAVGGRYVTQKFSVEIDAEGNQVIYTDQERAVIRYIKRVTDTAGFSPSFVQTLAWHLAAMLAGPVIKGDAGAAEAKRCMQMMQMWLSNAKESDAASRRSDVTHSVAWISGR